MSLANVSKCGRFVVVDALHVDRDVFEVLAQWAADRGLRMQDAIQLALCAFNERNGERIAGPPKTLAQASGHGDDPLSPERIGCVA